VPDSDETSTILVGRIVRPHGNRGHVVVAPETDFGAERFVSGAVLQGIRGDERTDLTVVASRPYDARWVVGFDGVTSIDEAEALRGTELHIPASALRQLPDGRYYLHDLVGCRVQTPEGRLLGEVRRVDTGAGPAVLVVETAAGECLIPFAEAICRRVDVEARLIVVAPPDGLLDLNR